LVMNNYQQVLEQKWLSALKKKYPVTINTAVWKTIQ
jgi:peptidyl-prolyl cis-trans isomerase SurA